LRGVERREGGREEREGGEREGWAKRGGRVGERRGRVGVWAEGEESGKGMRNVWRDEGGIGREGREE